MEPISIWVLNWFVVWIVFIQWRMKQFSRNDKWIQNTQHWAEHSTSYVSLRWSTLFCSTVLATAPIQKQCTVWVCNCLCSKRTVFHLAVPCVLFLTGMKTAVCGCYSHLIAMGLFCWQVLVKPWRLVRFVACCGISLKMISFILYFTFT